MSEAPDERLARNEAMFRLLNENIESIASTLGGGAPFGFICECASPGCVVPITLTLEEYERIREVGTRFLLAPGHERLEVEHVVAEHDDYSVVEKDGAAGLVALETNPRA